ncbi:MAG: MFS transporter [Chloroflexi bacterium]|nr:MFS transporter [Chloroflexota bacterium]
MNLLNALFSRMVFTVSGIWAVTEAGLSPLQLVLVGTALEASAFIFEIPTGVVADTVSRRLSIIIGLGLVGVGFLVWGSVAVFPTILAAQVLWGLGYTFTSGAEQAWLSDEIGEERMTEAFLRGSQMQRIGSLAGIFVSVALATFTLNLPMLLGGVGMIGLAVFLLLAMPEHGFTPTPREGRTSWRRLGGTFIDGLNTVRASTMLITILVIGAFFGASTESFDRLGDAHFLRDVGLPRAGGYDPVIWFGIINVSILLVGVAVTEVVRRRIKTDSHLHAARALMLIDGLLMVTVAGFALSGNFGLAFSCYLSARLMRGLHSPLFTAWLNRGLDPGVRATVLSMGSQADAFGQIIGGPILGLVATLVSIRASILSASLVLVPAVLLYGRMHGRTAEVSSGERSLPLALEGE